MTLASTSATGGATPAASSLLLALYAEAPLHAGTGQSVGVVDLPIQRERHTHFPLIPATSLKGSLRDAAEQHWRSAEASIVDALFGPAAQGGADLHAGALSLSDARLLAFPMRSLVGVFVWVTCPLAIGRLSRDLQRVGLSAALAIDAPAAEQARVASRQLTPGPLVLEDLSCEVTHDPRWAQIAGQLVGLLPEGTAHRAYRDKFRDHLVLLTDDDFAYCVRHATQVSARIQLDANKTTREGNLWYEETLPTDCLLYTVVQAERPRVPNGPLADSAAVRARLLELVEGDPGYLRVGGNETVGHGWCALRTVEEWPPVVAEADVATRRPA